MNIVIVGDGKVGYALTEQLFQEGHSVTVIDSNQKTLDATMDILDVMGIRGNGASRQVQMEAGVQEADLLIAATSGDELNMICCLTAKNLGAKNTIARIRNPEYMYQLQLFKEQFGLSMIINPELEAAKEIARIIKFPPALKVDTFSKGRVELVEFRLQRHSPLGGRRLLELPSRFGGSKILICAVERGGAVYIPGGSFMLQDGDKIYVTGENRAITNFILQIGDFSHRIRSVMIVGGGRLGYYLARSLQDARRYRIKIVEKDPERCNTLCELLPKTTIIQGDGSVLEVLESEGLESADAFIALTGMDEENMIMSMLASRRKVPKVVTKVNRFNYLDFVDTMGIDSVVSPKMSTANIITQYVRAMQNTLGSKVNTLHKLVGGKAEALEFTVGESTKHLGITLQELRLRPNILIAVIVRDGKVIIPHGQDTLLQGDNVMVVTNQKNLHDLNDIFEA